MAKPTPPSPQAVLERGLIDFDELPEPKKESEYFDKPGRVIASIAEVKVGITEDKKGNVLRYVVFTFTIFEGVDGGYEKGDDYTVWMKLDNKYNQRDLRCLAAAVAKLSEAQITMAKVVSMLAKSTEEGRADDGDGDITGELIEITLLEKITDEGKSFINPRFSATNVEAPF